MAGPRSKPSQSQPNGPGFLIGDSIGVILESYLSGFGFDCTGGYNITQTFGLGAPERDATKIRQAGGVVIELGTNPDVPLSSFRTLTQEMVNRVQKINSNVPIFWVEIFSKEDALVQQAGASYDAENAVIQSLSGVTVIPTKNLNISLQPDGVHPDTTGAKTLAQAIQKAVNTGGVVGSPSSGNSTGGGGISNANPSDVFAVARAAALSSTIELPGLLNYEAAIALKGDKSIYNDTPLMGFIQQLAQSSLRSFQSLPNGAFFSFYPDYFGAYNHRQPYWEIDDIEIIDGQISLSDQDLATHIFVVGDTMPDGQITINEQVYSTGVITIFDAFASNLVINGVAGSNGQIEKGKQKFVKLQDRTEAIAFLQRYGVRPHYEEAAFIRNHFFEAFYAFTQFQLYWSRQFLTEFQFTFMPELYPGGVVAFPQHGIRCYVDSVTHTFDYENGFLTQANLMAPASLDGSNSGVSRGMIRPLTASELKQLEAQNSGSGNKGSNN